jgi:hypothetical protein
MERFTKKVILAGHEAYFVSGDHCFDVWSVPKKFMGEALDRLAGYEDTGLTPEEVKALKAEVQSLKAEVDRLHKENFWLTQRRGE